MCIPCVPLPTERTPERCCSHQAYEADENGRFSPSAKRECRRTRNSLPNATPSSASESVASCCAAIEVTASHGLPGPYRTGLHLTRLSCKGSGFVRCGSRLVSMAR
jgi:hypothetical protein